MVKQKVSVKAGHSLKVNLNVSIEAECTKSRSLMFLLKHIILKIKPNVFITAVYSKSRTLTFLYKHDILKVKLNVSV